MNSIDEVVRVAVVAGDHHERQTDLRSHAGEDGLPAALSRHAIPGFRVDILDSRSAGAVEPHHDLIHLLDGGAHSGDALGIAAVAREHDINLVAGSPSVALSLAPAMWRLILSPSVAADRRLLLAGAPAGALWRWRPGVDPEEFGPAHYREGSFGPRSQRVNVLHVGPLTDPELILDAFAVASRLEPRLTLHLVGADADAERALGELGGAARFLTTPDRRGLAALYASADLLLWNAGHGESESFAAPVREAQASGLPVLAVDRGVASELIEDGRDGCLIPASVPAIAEALRSLARRAALRERLAVGGLSHMRARDWNWALAGLAAAWTAALTPHGAEIAHAA